MQARVISPRCPDRPSRRGRPPAHMTQLVEVRGTGPLGEIRTQSAEFPVRLRVWARRATPYLGLTASLNSFPAVNFTVRAAAISMGSPVFGFVPDRAGRSPTLNEPKPINWTVSLSATAFLMVRRSASRTLFTLSLDSSTSSETRPISSCLFKADSLLRLPAYADLRGTNGYAMSTISPR